MSLQSWSREWNFSFSMEHYDGSYVWQTRLPFDYKKWERPGVCSVKSLVDSG